MFKIIPFLLFFLPICLFAQSTSKEIYSFKTKNGKTMRLTLNEAKKQLVYKYGKEGKTELEFPADQASETCSKFTYSFYMRGGGKANEAMDMNHITFINDDYQYIIYDETSEGKRTVGITEINQNTKKKTKSVGIPKSVKGSLLDFRTNKLLKVVEESF